MGGEIKYLVTVPSFYINRYEVSQDEWYVIMGNNPSNQHRRNYPVDQINWYDANRFAKRLQELSGIPFRLPYEIEWEFAARGGTETHNYLYAGSNNPEEVAWYKKNLEANTYVSEFVGKRKPNELGIHDMSGNISEWCLDWYDKKNPFTGNINPNYKDEEEYKILRGGSFYTPMKYCNVSSRYGVNPKRWDVDYGMRLVVPELVNPEGSPIK